MLFRNLVSIFFSAHINATDSNYSELTWETYLKLLEKSLCCGSESA